MLNYPSGPKLVFKRDHAIPLTLEYGLEYYPGCFTPTGLRDNHTDELHAWCEQHRCGYIRREEIYRISFASEQDLAFFLLRWG